MKKTFLIPSVVFSFLIISFLLIFSNREENKNKTNNRTFKTETEKLSSLINYNGYQWKKGEKAAYRMKVTSNYYESTSENNKNKQEFSAKILIHVLDVDAESNAILLWEYRDTKLMFGNSQISSAANYVDKVPCLLIINQQGIIKDIIIPNSTDGMIGLIIKSNILNSFAFFPNNPSLDSWSEQQIFQDGIYKVFYTKKDNQTVFGKREFLSHHNSDYLFVNPEITKSEIIVKKDEGFYFKNFVFDETKVYRNANNNRVLVSNLLASMERISDDISGSSAYSQFAKSHDIIQSVRNFTNLPAVKVNKNAELEIKSLQEGLEEMRKASKLQNSVGKWEPTVEKFAEFINRNPKESSKIAELIISNPTDMELNKLLLLSMRLGASKPEVQNALASVIQTAADNPRLSDILFYSIQASNTRQIQKMQPSLEDALWSVYQQPVEKMRALAEASGGIPTRTFSTMALLAIGTAASSDPKTYENLKIAVEDVLKVSSPISSEMAAVFGAVANSKKPIPELSQKAVEIISEKNKEIPEVATKAVDYLAFTNEISTSDLVNIVAQDNFDTSVRMRALQRISERNDFNESDITKLYWIASNKNNPEKLNATLLSTFRRFSVKQPNLEPMFEQIKGFDHMQKIIDRKPKE